MNEQGNKNIIKFLINIGTANPKLIQVKFKTRSRQCK